MLLTMHHRETIAVCSDIRREHINSLYEKKSPVDSIAIGTCKPLWGKDYTHFQNDQKEVYECL